MTTPPRQHAPVGARPVRGAARVVSRCTPRYVSARLGPPGLASLLAFLLGPALALALLAGLVSPAGAQGPARERRDNLAVAPRPEADTGGVRASLRREIAFLGATRMARRLPPADGFTIGGRTIAAGTRVKGPVAVTRGPLVVDGFVEGDAVALRGDVIVRTGGHVTGNVTSYGGRVRAAGGFIDGEMRSLGLPGFLARPTPASSAGSVDATWRSLKLVLGWFAILVAIGIGVLIFAEGSFTGVSETLERNFGRSFWFGVLAQLAVLPGLLVIVTALALTIVGVLLIPFAVVAYAIAVAGLLTLGFLAVARFTGGSLPGATSGPRSTPRARALGALLRGLAVYLFVWLLAAAFTWSPLVGSVLRAVAVAVTWVVLTLGLGAAIGLRVERRGSKRRPATAQDPMVWLTPTPVTGVAAARRAKPAAVKEVG